MQDQLGVEKSTSDCPKSARRIRLAVHFACCVTRTSSKRRVALLFRFLQRSKTKHGWSRQRPPMLVKMKGTQKFSLRRRPDESFRGYAAFFLFSQFRFSSVCHEKRPKLRAQRTQGSTFWTRERSRSFTRLPLVAWETGVLKNAWSCLPSPENANFPLSNKGWKRKLSVDNKAALHVAETQCQSKILTHISQQGNVNVLFSFTSYLIVKPRDENFEGERRSVWMEENTRKAP